MKRYLPEGVILLLQILTFYVGPTLAGPTDVIAMVILMLFGTALLGFALGCLSGNKIKFLYPLATGLIFIPTIFIYYNSSASIHAVWYFCFALAGEALGSLLRLFFLKITRR